jgi:PAS domain S-box-containing protein
MSTKFEQSVVFAVMSILVVLFTWTYRRDRQQRTGLWMLGWIAILVHFAAPLLASFALLSPQLTDLLKIATLEICGVVFVLSVSEACTTTRRRIIFISLIGVPSVAYTACLIYLPGHTWVYPVILGLSVCAGVGIMASYYGPKSLYFYTFCIVFGTPGLLLIPQAAHHPVNGLLFFLCEYFAVAGLLYWRHFHRITPGVVFTSLSFVAWGAVFPVGAVLSSHGLGPPLQSFVWDLPKYFVAFGMVLTLFETQTEAATSAARRYEELFEGNLAAVYVFSLQGKLLECNSAFQDLYGFNSKSEALVAPAESLYATPGDHVQFVDLLQKHSHVLNYECEQRKKDGTRFWILERATMVARPGEAPVIQGTSIDITERKQTESALRKSEELFATVFRQSPTACVIVSMDGRFIDANDDFFHLLQLPSESVIGRTAVELGMWSPEERSRFLTELQSTGSVRNWKVEFNDANGTRHAGLYFATVVSINDKECIFGMCLDRTDQLELEARFLRAQKMEALGRLAGGVAHDFNNLLGILSGYAELLQAKLESDDTCSRYCTKVLETVERASGLTRQLLTFSHKEITQPGPLQPDKAIRELSAILPGLIGEDIELKVDLRSAGTVLMDKTHFQQIILNIVVNSRDAMPGGGQIMIATEDYFRPIASPSGEKLDGRCVAIRIRDTGLGMDEHTASRAFEPFFTTKDVGRGTGLGLATVYGIVQQCGGEISLESQAGKGTQVNVILPAVTAAEIVPLPELELEIKIGAGHILLVEDEQELRNASAEFLTSIGYTVVCAGSGPEALQLASASTPIDLVISDVVMPKMSGREFTDRLLQLRPRTKVLFVSGYADDVVLQAGIAFHHVPFLQKPFSLKQLGRKVTELLAVEAQ